MTERKFIKTRTFRVNEGEVYECLSCGKESEELLTLDYGILHMGEFEPVFDVQCPGCKAVEQFRILRKETV